MKPAAAGAGPAGGPSAPLRVVVFGSECTGKTTLARALAERFGVPWSEEYARAFVAAKGAAPEAGDVAAIARGQIAVEERAARTARRLLILDTDLLATLVYARHYYGAAPSWVERAALERRGDLYLLAGLDVPWRTDGLQRDRPAERQPIQALFRRALEAAGARWIDIEGPHEVRLEIATRAVRDLLATLNRR